MPADSVIQALTKTCDKESDPLMHQYTRGYVSTYALHKRLLTGEEKLIKYFNTLIAK